MSTVTHTFVDALPDLPADVLAGKVLPSHWNAVHTVTPLVSDGSEILVSKNTDPDNAANANFTITGSAFDTNPISGRWDQTYSIGYNLNQSGQPLQAGEASMGLHWESFFESGGNELLEFHLVHTSAAGNSVRWESWAHHRAADYVEHDSRFDVWSWHASDGTGFSTQTYSGGVLQWDWTSICRIRADFNNLPLFQQLNAASNAYLNLPYIDSSDRHVFRSFTAASDMPVGGNPFARIQPADLADGGTVVDVRLGTVAGSVAAQNWIGSIEGWALVQLFNQNTSSGSARAWFDLLVGGTSSGDPFMSFRINSGGTQWSIGLDNDDSDAFKICNAVFLGSNEAVRIGTDLGVLFGSYTAMAEMTAPSAPAANGVRIYAQDNGAGKTQLMALFSSGAAQQLAIQP